MMTPEEIERDRRDCEAARKDPFHSDASVVRLFDAAYQRVDDKTRAFMKAIAPYMFPPEPEK